ncbi:MAG: outer membrane protein assembly factor BamD [Simkania negevensis]|nr:outer membrane protein assembly factor BamD [Simkania negevensis]
MILEIKEHLAKDLYEIGNFYEKTKKKDSAVIYYKSILKKYPESKSAKEAENRLAKLPPLTEPNNDKQSKDKHEKKIEPKITVENEKKSIPTPS